MPGPFWRAGALLLALTLIAPSGAAALELDRRRMLNAAEHVPWRAVGQVNVSDRGAEALCTGTLIAEDLVLTAAHCVVSPLTGRPYAPDAVRFVAGARLGQKVAERGAAAIAVHPEFRLSTRPGREEIATDLGLIRLDRPIPRADAPPFETAPAPAEGTPLTLISYRKDRRHALTRQEGCDVVQEDAPVLTLGCDVTFGASGSPLFIGGAGEDGPPRVVAVVSARGSDGRRALALTVLAEAALPAVMAALP